MKLTKIGRIVLGQDGAIWEKYLFRFGSCGDCHVYDLDTLEAVAEFSLDGLDVWMPHSNSVMFGCEYYAEGDEFPLLYTNVYNTYGDKQDRREGVCCVYRLSRQEDSFRGQLVQTITVGFVGDENLWCSAGRTDVRPYGNFAIDREQGIYYGFTMRDGADSTRYFAFRLPKLEQGENVTLTPEDILFWFDCPYHRYIQGACVHHGKIYSLEGFTDSEDNPPAIRIIDPALKKQLCYVQFADLGTTIEPEMIDFREERCYYADSDGNLYMIEGNAAAHSTAEYPAQR